jgi:SPX domain protein involved in polyphosphate accumulation
MKYGETFEADSVPRWSLYNIDYNSLKQLIKLHTTKGQATAIAIPGQVDHALERFENDFYNELCDQHDRVGLFVTSKADELSRRLASLSDAIGKLTVRCAGPRGLTSKRQSKFVKYQQQLAECGDDIRDLQRFVRAQVTALRKILKKYKVCDAPAIPFVPYTKTTID